MMNPIQEQARNLAQQYGSLPDDFKQSVYVYLNHGKHSHSQFYFMTETKVREISF